MPAHRVRESRVVAATVVAVLAASCGSDPPQTVTATPGDVIEVEMRQNSFSYDEITLAAPGRVEFAFDNVDRAGHEAFIGTEEDQADVIDLRDESRWIELGRYEQGSLAYSFDEPGTYVVGCHIAGHYRDGMLMTVVVS